jgi:hypothetical protein
MDFERVVGLKWKMETKNGVPHNRIYNLFVCVFTLDAGEPGATKEPALRGQTENCDHDKARPHLINKAKGQSMLQLLAPGIRPP